MDKPQEAETTPPGSNSPSSGSETKRSLPPTNDNDNDNEDSSASHKRAKTTAKQANIVDENTLLLQLKDSQNLGWPAIAEAFQQHGWAGRKAGLLKNRYRSLKDGTVFWEDSDVDCMHQAIFQVEQEYERTRWESVAQRMEKLGASRRFTGAACEKKFRAKVKGRKEGPSDVPDEGDSKEVVASGDLPQ